MIIKIIAIYFVNLIELQF